MTPVLWGLALLLVWTLVALFIGYLLGESIHTADRNEGTSDETWLRDQPTDVLPATEVDREFTAIARGWDA